MSKLEDRFEELLKELNKRFASGQSIKVIQQWLISVDIDQWLITELLSVSGVGKEFLFNHTGLSAGVTREERPKLTKNLIIKEVIKKTRTFRKDIKKVKKNPRSNSVIAGEKISKKFRDSLAKEPTQRELKKLMTEQIDLIESKLYLKQIDKIVTNRSFLYIQTEYRSVTNIKRRDERAKEGYKYIFINTTKHGHQDECKPFERKFFDIDSGVQLPPYHPRCKHKATFVKKLPARARVSTPPERTD